MSVMKLQDLVKLWEMIERIDNVIANCKFDLENCICQPKVTDLMEVQQVLYSLLRLKEDLHKENI